MFLNITARSFQRQSTLTKLVTDWSVFVHVLLFHWACQPALSPKSHFPHKKKSPFSVQSMPWPVSNLSLAASTVLWSWSLLFAWWQTLCEGTKGLRRKVWTRTKILSPNIRYFVTILRFVAICALFGSLRSKEVFFGSKTEFLGHYYMVLSEN